MRGKAGWVAGGVAGIAIVGVVIWWATREREDEHADREAPGADEAAADDEYASGWFGDVGEGEDPRDDPPMKGPRWPDRPGGDGWGRGGGAPWGDGQMPERFRRRFEIVALGDTPPTITPEQLIAVVREHRGELRACVQNAGGWRALRDQIRSGDAGRRGRPRATFDLDASGRIVEGTFNVDPPLPPQIGGCVQQVFTGLTFPTPGPDGARVEMPVGPGGGRGGGGGGRGRGGRGAEQGQAADQDPDPERERPPPR